MFNFGSGKKLKAAHVNIKTFNSWALTIGRVNIENV